MPRFLCDRTRISLRNSFALGQSYHTTSCHLSCCGEHDNSHLSDFISCSLTHTTIPCRAFVFLLKHFLLVFKSLPILKMPFRYQPTFSYLFSMPTYNRHLNFLIRGFRLGFASILDVFVPFFFFFWSWIIS